MTIFEESYLGNIPSVIVILHMARLSFSKFFSIFNFAAFTFESGYIGISSSSKTLEYSFEQFKIRREKAKNVWMLKKFSRDATSSL